MAWLSRAPPADTGKAWTAGAAWLRWTPAKAGLVRVGLVRLVQRVQRRRDDG
jgi:hypothetical protein